MKSLNRTLSLVLVLAMVLGLMGVASAKTFTDDATVQYKTAVGVMVGIGAIDGYSDGSFKPAGAITREEAAKMITYAILGASVAKTLTVSSTGFKDVAADRWSAPFITYLVNKGIINGMGDGTFAPTANVTGFQLAKMLLCAAGYGKQGEFTGDSWSLNVAVLGNSKGIFTDTKATSFSTAATREEAALYVYNALVSVNQVVWDKSTDSYVSAGNGTIGKAVYGIDLATATTTVKTDMITGSTQNAEKTKTYVTGTGTSGKFDGGSTYIFTPTVAQFGHKVDLYTGTGGAVYYVNDACKEYVVPSAVAGDATALKAALTKLNGGTMVTYASDTTIPKFTNSAYDSTGFSTGSTDVSAGTAPTLGNTYVIYKNTVIAIKTTTKAMEAISVTIDKDKNVVAKIVSPNPDVVIYDNTKATIATNGVATNKIVYNGTIDWTSFIVGYDATSSVNQTGVAYFNCEGLGSSDYAVAPKISLTDITKVAGTASAVNTAGGKLTVNGTTYDVAITDAGDEHTGIYGDSANFDAALLSGSYKFWLNNAGKIFYIQTVTASDTSSYLPALVNAMWKVQSGVDAYGAVSYKYYAQVVTSDGKLGTYEIASKNGLKPAEAAVANVSYDASGIALSDGVNYWFASVTGSTVALKTTSTLYTFADVATQTTITKSQVVIGSDMYFTGASSIVTVNDVDPNTASAAALVKASGVAKSAMETQTFTTQTLKVAYKVVSGTNVVQAVFIEGAYAGVTTDIYFIAKYNGQISAGTVPTYSYTAFKLGVAAPVNLVSTSSDGAALVGTFKSIQTSATGDAFTSATTATLVADGAMSKVTANTRVVNDYYVTLTRGTTDVATNKLATTAAVFDLRAAVAAGTATAYTNVSEIPTGTYVFAVYNGSTSATQTGLTTIFVVDGSSACALTDPIGTSGTNYLNITTPAHTVLHGTVAVSALTASTGATIVVKNAGGTVQAAAHTLAATDVITVTALDGTVTNYTLEAAP